MIVEPPLVFVVDDSSASERIEDLFQPTGLFHRLLRGGVRISSGLDPMHLVASVDAGVPGIQWTRASESP
jgi:hypothetical protein